MTDTFNGILDDPTNCIVMDYMMKAGDSTKFFLDQLEIDLPVPRPDLVSCLEQFQEWSLGDYDASRGVFSGFDSSALKSDYDRALIYDYRMEPNDCLELEVRWPLRILRAELQGQRRPGSFVDESQDQITLLGPKGFAHMYSHVSMNVNDCCTTLERRGYRIRLSGRGDYVIKFQFESLADLADAQPQLSRWVGGFFF